MVEKNIRCVNIDWLEVFTHEPNDRKLDVKYFMDLGYNVKIREYGTRVYNQMFTICTPFDEPLLEIRRDPASIGQGGLFMGNECHIRLSNRSCYFDDAALLLYNFLETHRYYDTRISRIDICLDFVTFDKGDKPEAFVRRYFSHKYAKINQGRITGHGEDTWSGQNWNSLSWGAKSSCVTTKLYNKTIELYDEKQGKFRKPYIREAWARCGLIDNVQNVTKENVRVDVWRVEFTIKSSVKNWIPIDVENKKNKYHSIPNTLKCYTDREKLLVYFASLSRHYFRFKKFVEGQRKDRCPEKVLFDFRNTEVTYKIGKSETALGSGTNYQSKHHRLLTQIESYKDSKFQIEVKEACDTLIKSLREDYMREDMANPRDTEETKLYKMLLHVATRHPEWTYEAKLRVAMQLVKINPKLLE